ncbi:MAG: CBS domain-containing protein [Streptosporangiaceae bacterium]
MKVGEIMTTRVITVGEDAPVPQIAAVLRENRISAVPVLDASGGVVGLVSEHDLPARTGKVARDVMTSSVISVTEDTDVDDVRRLLVERRIRRVPVLSGARLARDHQPRRRGRAADHRVGVRGLRRDRPRPAPAAAVPEMPRRPGPVHHAGPLARAVTAAPASNRQHRNPDAEEESWPIPTRVLMPRLSDTMEEGTLSQWVKHEGDQVRKGDILAVIETDKAAMDMEAYDEGVLTRILVEEGSSVPIGTPIAVIGQVVAGVPASPPTAPPPPADMPPPGQRPATPAAAPAATPAAGRGPAARWAGLDLTARPQARPRARHRPDHCQRHRARPEDRPRRHR